MLKSWLPVTILVCFLFFPRCTKDKASSPPAIEKYEVRLQNLTWGNPDYLITIRLNWQDQWYVNSEWSTPMIIGEFQAGKYQWEIEFFLTGQEPNPDDWVWVPMYDGTITLDKDLTCKVFLLEVEWQ